VLVRARKAGADRLLQKKARPFRVWRRGVRVAQVSRLESRRGRGGRTRIGSSETTWKETPPCAPESERKIGGGWTSLGALEVIASHKPRRPIEKNCAQQCSGPCWGVRIYTGVKPTLEEGRAAAKRVYPVKSGDGSEADRGGGRTRVL